ncbi:hypothetical protein ONZ45_g1557 [Pleurotus djamor]|nr:hypothetical protein ONZ45_g1557 [Pleurotus djamor]
MSSKQPGGNVRTRNAIDSRKTPAHADALAKVLLIDCPHKDTSEGRNLIVNLDGTANQFSEYSTNVVELFSRLIKDITKNAADHTVEQLVYYNSGIGTYARPTYRSWNYVKQVIDHTIDTAIAWNFEAIVHGAYEWISENYMPGDRIFLFGFSRGAYQARVIAGMIHRVGLLHKGNKSQIPFAYELYASVTEREERQMEVSDETQTVDDRETFLCKQFKASLCHTDVKVHFVGAWDTVSSIGVLKGKSLPETVSGMGHVCAFRHALALDERRVKFQPEYVNGGQGPEPKGKNGQNQQRKTNGDVKEVWFAGSHSDIGGGSTRNADLKNFGPALRWMTYEAMKYGLRIRPYEGKWETPQPTESLVGVFWLFLELLPFPRLTYADANSITLWPHLAAPRKVQPGQLVHQSVFSTPNRVAVTSLPHNDVEIPAMLPWVAAFRDYAQHLTKRWFFGGLNDEFNRSFDDVISLSGFMDGIFDDEADDTGSIPGAFDVLPIKLDTHFHPVGDDSADIDHGPIPGAFPGPSEELKVPYRPVAVFSENMQSSWEHLFKKDSDSKLIEMDPFANASHLVKAFSEILLPTETDIDQAPNVDAFDVNLAALRSFISDETRLASLLEVNDVETMLWAALSFSIEHPKAARSRESKEMLIRLIAKADSEGNGPVSNAEIRRPKAAQVQRWLSPVETAFRDDLRRVVQLCACLRTYDLDYRNYPLKFSPEHPSRIIFASQRSFWRRGSHSVCPVMWDISGPSEMPRVLDDISLPGLNVTLSSDGTLMAAADGSRINIVEIGSNTTIPSVDDAHGNADDESAEVSWLCFSGDDQTMASGHCNGLIKFWRQDKGAWKVYKCIECAENKIEDLYFSPNDSVLAFTVRPTPRVAKLCWPADGSVHQLEGSEGASSVAWGPNSSIACGTETGELIRWDHAQKKSRKFKANDGWISILVYRNDGRLLATGGSNGVIRVWDCTTWSKIWDFRAHEEISSIAFSSDGKRIASGGIYGGLYLWDVDLEANDEEESHKPVNN